MILMSFLPYSTIHCVPCWIVTLSLSIIILLFDLVFHEDMNNEIILAKRQKGKAERKWKASKAHIDLLSYRTIRSRVTFLSNKARTTIQTS